jgi:hypothetical protein
MVNDTRGHDRSNGSLEREAAKMIPGVTDVGGGGSDRAIITVNQINLTGRQIWTIITGIASMIGAGMAGGWLFIPAKSSELEALRAVVEIVRTEQQASREAIGNLAAVITSLEQSVDAFRLSPPKVIERISPAPRRR